MADNMNMKWNTYLFALQFLGICLWVCPKGGPCMVGQDRRGSALYLAFTSQIVALKWGIFSS